MIHMESYFLHYTDGNPYCHYFRTEHEYVGEYKEWEEDGTLFIHCFFSNGKEVVDFLENPEEFPSSDQDRLLFKLKYGAEPFLDEDDNGVL